MDSGSVVERVCQIAEQAAIDHGVELVHTEVAGPEGHPVVRVFIDKPERCNSRGLFRREHPNQHGPGRRGFHSLGLHLGSFVTGAGAWALQTARL